MGIETLDTLEHIQKNTRMYLGTDEVQLDVLAINIVNDAIVLGATSVLIIKHQKWFVVAADIDWLNIGHDKQLKDVFINLLPLKGGGQNALRREVLLMAFVNDIIILDDTCNYSLIKGDCEGWPIEMIKSKILSMQSYKRIVVFS